MVRNEGRALEDALARLRPQGDAVDAQRAELLESQRAIDEEVARLAEAIAAGGPLTSLLAALKAREAQRAHAAQADFGHLARDLRARLAEWRKLLGRQVAREPADCGEAAR